jgi:soluble lytic murein transglycosylase
MQVLPSTAKYIAKREKIRSYHQAADLRDPLVNLRVGIAYLSYLRERFPHSNQYLAAYNLGPDRLRKMVNGNGFAVERMRSYVFQIRDGVAKMRNEGAPDPAVFVAVR